MTCLWFVSSVMFSLSAQPAGDDAAPEPALVSQLVGAQVAAAEAKAKAEVAEAEAKAEIAEVKAKAAEEKAEDASAKYRDLASGKFIENGVTGGLALTLQTPFVEDKATVQQGTAVTTTLTPYLLLVPAYWRQQPEVNRFCASHWSTDIVRAQAAADQMAKDRADAVSDTIVSYIQSGLDAAAIRDARGGGKTRSRREWVAPLEGLAEPTYAFARSIACDNPSEPAAKCKPRAPKDDEKRALNMMVARDIIGWTPGARASLRSCVLRKFGFWIGFPVNPYKARVEANKYGVTSNLEREVNPVVSFGLAFTPNATISGLVGVTYSRVTLPTPDMNVQRDSGMWTFTFGIGGNLDLINAFRK